MKNNFLRIGFGLAIVIAVVVLLTAGFLKKPAKEPVKPAGKGFVVIELFTSEGCSSCPQADVEVEKISVLHPEDVYVLGFHVDYWDRLGWKDEYSDAAYSERQRRYAEHFNLSSVYTPQVVVNGKKQLVGSNATGLNKSVVTEISHTTNQAIELSAIGSGGKTVQVTYKITPPANSAINIALIQIAAQTRVKGGENEGRTLRHINIVRDFKTINSPGKTGTATIALPNDITAKECKVIVYLQQHTREVTGVAVAFIK
ncbi:MAG: DUF1223 domain-containing protein [Ferruginibacter sp.]